MTAQNNHNQPPNGADEAFTYLPMPPDLVRLKSALSCLSPECDPKTFTYHRIGPIAREARLYPEMKDALYETARDWSNGNPRFENTWRYFINQTGYTGKIVSLGTIYHAAKLAGWEFDPSDSGE